MPGTHGRGRIAISTDRLAARNWAGVRRLPVVCAWLLPADEARPPAEYFEPSTPAK